MAHETILPTELLPPAPARRPARVGLAEVYAAIAIVSFLVARFVPVLQLHYPCPFRTATSLPCATCGMTHAFVFLAHGDVARAFAWSPLGAALAAGAWAFGAADLLRFLAGWPLPRLEDGHARAAVMIGFAALILNWGWLLWHGLGPR